LMTSFGIDTIASKGLSFSPNLKILNL
jgi:hypothetical protein